MKRRILIDTDPGQDDALAILLALSAPELFEVAAITTVAGNVAVEQTTHNALKICALAGRVDLPVHKGCEAPILRPLHTAEFVCGADGLRGWCLQTRNKTPMPNTRSTPLSGCCAKAGAGQHLRPRPPHQYRHGAADGPRNSKPDRAADHHGRRTRPWQHDRSGRVQLFR
ncbi:nucleoside hydrolase [Phycobium rhodophyticola]